MEPAESPADSALRASTLALGWVGVASVSHFSVDLTLSPDFYLPITCRPLGVPTRLQ